nr:MAG TPA: hypothetical protein [Caudoviricetes sp.]
MESIENTGFIMIPLFYADLKALYICRYVYMLVLFIVYLYHDATRNATRNLLQIPPL